MMRIYRDTIESEYGDNGLVLYASKAFSCEAIYRIAAQENIGVDVVSGGELYTALKAGFPASKIYMHGNNKLDYEIEEALDARVGCIVADATEEIDKIEREAAKRTHRSQNILLRINPGVEAHTHAYIQTAKTDSKFGFSVADGTAEKARRLCAFQKITSVCEASIVISDRRFLKSSRFVLAAEKCMDFAAEMKEKLGFVTEELNLGGGFGIWYTDEDKKIPPEGYREYLEALISAVKRKAGEKGLKLPFLIVEPGRSIVGEAGITLYTVGAIKEIPGVRKYVAVDGGMFDNPRYALYQAKYTPVLAVRGGGTGDGDRFDSGKMLRKRGFNRCERASSEGESG